MGRRASAHVRPQKFLENKDQMEELTDWSQAGIKAKYSRILGRSYYSWAGKRAHLKNLRDTWCFRKLGMSTMKSRRYRTEERSLKTLQVLNSGNTLWAKVTILNIIKDKLKNKKKQWN